MDGVPANLDYLEQDHPSPLTWAHSLGFSVAILRQGEVGAERWTSFMRSFSQSGTSRLLLFMLGPVDLAPVRRRALTHAIADRHVAAIVDSVVGRGMITALGWSGVSIEIFPLSCIRAALASLDPESDGESIEQCLDLAARLIAATDLSNQIRAILAPPRPF